MVCIMEEEAFFFVFVFYSDMKYINYLLRGVKLV